MGLGRFGYSVTDSVTTVADAPPDSCMDRFLRLRSPDATRFHVWGQAMTLVQPFPRMVISGVGVISPIGIERMPSGTILVPGGDWHWTIALGPPAVLSRQARCRNHDFNPLKYLYEKKFIKVMSRDIQLGVCAASLAMKDSA